MKLSPTVRLYDIDSHISNFTATVVRCIKDDDASEKSNHNVYAVILDKTAFFPGGGGQLPDVGKFKSKNKISSVVASENPKIFGEGVIIHYSDDFFSEGELIECNIDYDKRFRRMQNHSGEHIISGIAHSIFGCDNVGFHMGSENITVDFNVKLSDEQIKQLELSANKAVFENKKIHIKYYSPSELSSINFRSKKNFDCDVRIVTIDDYDSCACCAPHVQQTGEIGCIKIIDSINYKGGVRLFVLCGYDALNYYSYLNMNNKMISQSLSVKQSETLQGFYCNEKEILSLKQSIHDITDAFIKNITESTPETNGNIVRFEPFLDKSSMRILVNSLMPLTSGMCAVFKESGNGGYDYVIGSLNVDMTKEINSVNSSLFGSGGGSKTMICGKVTASRTDIENFFAVAKV